LNTLPVNASYFMSERPEVAALVPWGASRVLDIGCGFGGLAPLLIARQVKKIYGIELNQSASIHLQKFYDEHWIGSVEHINLPLDTEPFDCIIFSDILEHLISPWDVLTKFTNYLADDGIIVASIPNIRNMGIIYRLLCRGCWSYSDSGILDRTHLRFFTRSSIEELFLQAGLTIESVGSNRDNYSQFRRLVTAIPRFFIPDLEICQFLVRAKKSLQH